MSLSPYSEYSLTIAHSRELVGIFAFLLANPEKNLRAVSLEEVQCLINNGQFVVVRHVPKGNRIIATCYTKDQPPGYEMGGALVDPDHRRRGLGKLMIAVAIANHYFAVADDLDRREESVGGLIAHVVKGNERIAGTMVELGFDEIESDATFSPDYDAGLARLPTEKDGKIHARVFRFDPERYRDLFKWLARTYGEVTGENNETHRCEIQVPLLTREVLRRAASD